MEQVDKLGPKSLLALFLWQDRKRNPNLSRTVTQADVDKLQACTDYLEVEPDVVILRRPTGVVVSLVQKGTEIKDKEGNITSPGDAITPIENSEADHEDAVKQRHLNGLRQGAKQLAIQVASEEKQGIVSSETMSRVVETLTLLANE